MSFRTPNQIKQYSWAALAIGTVTLVGGAIGKSKAKKKAKKSLAERQANAFETPEEVFQILNATEQGASTGLGSETIDYLTGQTDRAASQAYGSANLLGGDPNDLSAIFDQKMQGMMKIGAQNHAANLQNFSRYLMALDTVGKNREAEWGFQDNLRKDQSQAAAAAGADANKMMGQGLNTIIGGVANAGTSNLYKDSPDAPLSSTYTGESTSSSTNPLDRAFAKKFGT